MSDDNIRRKCKFLVINNLQNFINNQIICKVPSSPKLLTLNQSQIFKNISIINSFFNHKWFKKFIIFKNGEKIRRI